MSRKAIEAALQRGVGQSPAVREEVKKINAEATDWYGTCRRCGKERKGTLEELAKPCECAI